MAPAVVVRNVSKTFSLPQERVHTLKERALHPLRRQSFDRLRAVQDVSFEVEKGEFFGIVGRNGSGKSTLLKCLAGIYGVDSGDVFMRGRLSAFIELGVGFNPDLAARDNAILNAVMLGLSAKEAAERYERILEFSELQEFEELKIKNYSSGMLVRLAFAVMIQADADVLLIDEVLAVGDAAFQQKCFDEFDRLRAERRTILFVTHDMTAVARFCDRAMLLERGKMTDIGAPRDIGRHYFEVNFGEDGLRLPVNEMTAPADAPVHRGTGEAEIADAWFEDDKGERVDVLRPGQVAAFVAVVRFAEPLEDPTFGFALSTRDGTPVFATSTRLSGDGPTGSFRAGELVGFRVAFENHVAPGRYFANPWLGSADGSQRYVRVERLAPLRMTGEADSGGMVDLPHWVRVERQDAPAT